MPNEREILKIEFDVTGIRSKAIRKIQQTTGSVTFIYHALLNYNPDELLPLQTDSLPIVVGGLDSKTDTAVARKNGLDWVMRKAFEDFIIALSESLIEACAFLKLETFAKESKIHPLYGLGLTEQKIASIKEKPRKMSFPDLISEIEKESGHELYLKKEILSVNAVRNCLIHRNGVVSDLDTRNEPDNILRLHVIDLLTFYRKDDRMIEMKWEDKGTIRTDVLQFGVASKAVEIRSGTEIKIDQNIINAVAYTCVSFIEHLYAAIVPSL